LVADCLTRRAYTVGRCMHVKLRGRLHLDVVGTTRVLLLSHSDIR